MSKRVLITGAAGFIGSYLAEFLLDKEFEIIGIDDLSNGSMDNLEACRKNSNFTFFEHDVCDTVFLREVMSDFHISEVWHLAANTDIISSHDSPMRDFKDCAEATVSVLEAMRFQSVKKIIFASSGSVYGNLGSGLAVKEDIGPLKPLSTYGAGKLASEGFIAAYANLFGIQSHIFRFGNVLGSRINHGVIYDFIDRLYSNNSKLLVLGNGNQEKNYFRVSDCIGGMWHISNIALEDGNCRILNLGNSSLTNVLSIAKICSEVAGTQDTEIEVEGKLLAWPGDQPIIRLDCTSAFSYNWECEFDSDESVLLTAQELYELKVNS